MKSKSGKNSSEKNTKKISWDHQKDIVFKGLAEFCHSRGLTVRREDLKQGHGWRVMSGTCRMNDQKLIFIDRKLPQDEQILFLASRLAALKIEVPAEELTKLPENVKGILSASSLSEAA